MALSLLLPVPSIGVLFGMILLPEHIAGKLIFFASKVWILAVPLFWHLVIDKQKLSWSEPVHGGFGVAVLIGVVISAIILIGYFAIGKYLIDVQLIKDMAQNTGLANPYVYLCGAVYWITVNSVLEEYVWRWFVVQRCRILMPVSAAIAASAFFFTVHHIVAMQIYFNWLVVTIASVGIFIGGAVWSWCYVRYRSIWPGYVSHAIVDVAVFAIGYFLIF